MFYSVLYHFGFKDIQTKYLKECRFKLKCAD